MVCSSSQLTSETVNVFVHIWQDSLDGGSASRMTSTCTGQHNTEKCGQTSMPQVVFEPTIPAESRLRPSVHCDQFKCVYPDLKSVTFTLDFLVQRKVSTEFYVAPTGVVFPALSPYFICYSALWYGEDGPHQQFNSLSLHSYLSIICFNIIFIEAIQLTSFCKRGI
jgi:hypothetical protein